MRLQGVSGVSAPLDPAILHLKLDRNEKHMTTGKGKSGSQIGISTTPTSRPAAKAGAARLTGGATRATGPNSNAKEPVKRKSGSKG